MSSPGSKRLIRVTGPRGLASVLAAEIGALGIEARVSGEDAAECQGGWSEIFSLNLRLRTAHRVLWLAGEEEAQTPDDVYEAAMRVPWEEVLRTDRPFQVRAAVEWQNIADPRFVALRVKDAVADRMRAKVGRRPDSGADIGEGAALFAHWAGNGRVRFFYDTSGWPLSNRGYRVATGDAPLRESLAAGLLLWSQWKPPAALVNPMCGSGALAIEAALLGAGMAPGLLRSGFAFLHLRGFDAEMWRSVRETVRAERGDIHALPPIIASDADAGALARAESNAVRAGLQGVIQFHQCDYAHTPVPAGERWIVINPPYGLRMGEEADLEKLYPALGAWLRQAGGPGRGVVISGNLRLAKRFGLKASRIVPVFNGPVECRALEFPLFSREAPSPA